MSFEDHALSVLCSVTTQTHTTGECWGCFADFRSEANEADVRLESIPLYSLKAKSFKVKGLTLARKESDISRQVNCVGVSAPDPVSLSLIWFLWPPLHAMGS